MKQFNPYLVDEIITQSNLNDDPFGLIARSELNQAELHGYEISMSGKLVIPELKLQADREEQ